MQFYFILNTPNGNIAFNRITVDLIILGLSLVAIAMIFCYTLLTGSPPTPTSPKVRNAMLALLPKRLPEVFEDKGRVYELGAGWGGNALVFARMFSSHRVIAIERSPLPWVFTWIRLATGGPKNLEIHLNDFSQYNLCDAALVSCYLSARQMEVLEKKLEREMVPGTLVVCHTFAMPNWQPIATVYADDLYKSPVYLYKTPNFKV